MKKIKSRARTLSANSEDFDQTTRYAVSDLDLHYLPMWTRGMDIVASLFCMLFVVC